MIRSSFWKFGPIFFGKTFKSIRKIFYVFPNLEKVHFSNWVIYMRSFSSIDAKMEKLLASQKRDRFPVGACRGGPGRDLNREPYTHK